MNRFTAIFAAACAVISLPCIAAPAGTASGSYIEKKLFEDDPGPAIKLSIPVVYAAALRKDDAEGVLGDDAGIWVLLSDKPVDAMAMAGGEFPPARRMAKDGAFRGIMFSVKPGADKTRLVITLMAENPESPGQLSTVTMSRSEGLWKALEITRNRISGSFDDGDAVRFNFDAPIAENLITQDLRGPAALASPQAQAVIAMAKAQEAGDFEAIQRLSSRGSWAELAKLSAEDRAALVKQTRDAHDLADAMKITRVTVRGKVASAQSAGGTFDLVLEDGVWKVD